MADQPEPHRIDRSGDLERAPAGAAAAGPPAGAAAAQAGAVVLAAVALPFCAAGLGLIASLRFTHLGLPLTAWCALAGWTAWSTWRRPTGPTVRWAIAVGAVSAGGVVAYLRMIRPLDTSLGAVTALLTLLLGATALLAWSRLAPRLDASDHPRCARAGSALAGVALVVIGAVAPLVDQPPFAPLRLAAVAEVDADCGLFHVDDPRGMGSVGFDSVEPAPTGWARRRGALVLHADERAHFEADGRRFTLVPSNGLSPCP